MRLGVVGFFPQNRSPRSLGAWSLALRDSYGWCTHQKMVTKAMIFQSICLRAGFVARTQDKGLVVTTWAPQSDILAHPSVGGFLSHCGWSFALESILNLKLMSAWPLFAEQKMLATQQVEELKVSIRPKVLPTKAIVKREEMECW